MGFPLHRLVTRPSESSQRWFATEAARRVAPSDRIAVESQDDGLLIRGITEVDIERACLTLMQEFSGLDLKKPQVNYKEDSKGRVCQEPYYLITVEVPDDVTGVVVGELIARRVAITGLENSTLGKKIMAGIPVCEAFGYGVTLRSRTRGRGIYRLEFIGYKPIFGYPRGGNPLGVA